MKIRSYTELSDIYDYVGRFNYLKLSGVCGEDNPEVRRWLHQIFYHSAEWKRARREVVMRDGGCDLGIADRPIMGMLLVHHMNPITLADIKDRNPDIYNPEYLITTTKLTHNAIHYGDEDLLVKDFIERRPGDTCPWK